MAAVQFVAQYSFDQLTDRNDTENSPIQLFILLRLPTPFLLKFLCRFLCRFLLRFFFPYHSCRLSHTIFFVYTTIKFLFWYQLASVLHYGAYLLWMVDVVRKTFP